MFGKKKQAKVSVNGRQSTEPLRDEKPRGEVAPSALDKEKKRKKHSPSNVFSGEVLYTPTIRRHYPFMLYCCVLILLYMGYHFSCQRLQREEISCQMELQRLRAKSLLISTERHRATSHDNIIKEIERRNLEIKQWNTPPTLINNTNEATTQK